MTTVAVISDTHLPAAGPNLPVWATELIESADHVLHGGDVINPDSYFELRVLAGGEITTVEGNRDHALSLPAIATHEAEGVRFVMTHGHDLGRSMQYQDALASLARERNADVAIGGHTHEVLDVTVDGIRVLNPGSVTGAAPATQQTMLTVECEDASFVVTRHGV